MNKITVVCFSSLFLLTVARPALAQVTARQGTAASEGVERFNSPMILEIPLHVVDPATWGKGQLRGGERLSRFICEGVYLRDFAVSATKLRGGKKVRLTYHVVLANEPGVDMLTWVVIEIVRPGEPPVRAATGAVDIEEGQTLTRSPFVVLSSETLTAKPLPTLRLMISTKRNG